MFNRQRADMALERDELEEALGALQAWTPDSDPEHNARARSLNFVQGELGALSKRIDQYRILGLCLRGMQPETTPAGPASPIPAPEPKPEEVVPSSISWLSGADDG